MIFRSFPAPREAWVVSYKKVMLILATGLLVSVPSRGLVGGLHELLKEKVLKRNSFRPLSRLGWFPTLRYPGHPRSNPKFPSPLEAWVVSYEKQKMEKENILIVSGPSRGMGGVLLLNFIAVKTVMTQCFRPLLRLGWFPTMKGR